MTREDELIRQIQKGRQECLDELIELYYPDIKRSLPSAEPLSEEPDYIICRPESGYQAAEDRQLLAAAFTCLQEDQRELILLRYGQELTLREIAAVTGLPLRTVQTRLSRTLKKLRLFLKNT